MSYEGKEQKSTNGYFYPFLETYIFSCSEQVGSLMAYI